MALAHVLLTSLLEKPSSGLELARRFDRSMGFFWNASHQQIYRELSSMQLKGWISTLEPELDNDANKRKKTYQVEQSGRIELAQWSMQQSEPAQLREDLMVRLRADAQLKHFTLLPELQRHLQLHCEKLKLYQQIYNKDFLQNTSTDRVLYIHKMILKLGIHLEQGWVDWLSEVIPNLEQLEKDTQG